MLKKIEQEVTICDVPNCERREVEKCLGCGKSYCLEHSEQFGDVFKGDMIKGGPVVFDNYFCHTCIAIPPDTATRDKILAYNKMNHDKNTYIISLRELERLIDKG